MFVTFQRARALLTGKKQGPVEMTVENSKLTREQIGE